MKPSAFFGTPLISYPTQFQVDTLLVGGGTTSGCVRASVVEECTFDRGQASHKINLFDMNAKYADVVSLTETEKYLAGLPGDLYV